MPRTRHFSHYINWSQLAGIITACYLGRRALAVEEAKVGIEHRPLSDVIHDDIVKVKHWVLDKTLYRQYRHL